MDALREALYREAEKLAAQIDRDIMREVDRQKRRRVFEDTKRCQRGDPVPVILDAYGRPWTPWGLYFNPRIRTPMVEIQAS